MLNSANLKHLSLEAAIVDLDGTMLDTLDDFVVALDRVMSDLQLPAVESALVRRLVGKGSEYLVRSVLRNVEGTAASEAMFAQAWALYLRHYQDINGQHSMVYPGVVACLDGLRQRGLKLGCLTNKPIAFARPLLDAKGLGGYFSAVFGGDSFERKKPDPLPLLKTCEALGSAPQRTLMLGDSSNDAKAARAAGCPVVLVTYGYNHGEPVRAVDADGWVDSLEELLR